MLLSPYQLRPSHHMRSVNERYWPHSITALCMRNLEIRRPPAPGSPGEFAAALSTRADLHAEGLMMSVGPFFYDRVDQIVALAARYRIPTIHDHRRYIVVREERLTV